MTIKSIDAQTLKRWLDNGEALLVDAREPAEHAAENIAGSTLLPLGKLTKSTLPEMSGKKLVIHCRSGKRSTNACAKLLNEDPNMEVYSLEGGISAWSAAGHSIESSNKSFLPLDRQVQLTIGLGVLIGSLLAFFVNPLFFILTSFFGAGLVFAGISGTCGLALLIAKMPWNQSPNNKSLGLK